MKANPEFKEEMEKIAREFGFMTMPEALDEICSVLLAMADDMMNKANMLMGQLGAKIDPEIEERAQKVNILLNYLKEGRKRGKND